LVEGLRRDLPIILLDHQPFDLQQTADNGVALQVSGHTHGGQFFPGNLFARLVFEKLYGYTRIGNTHVYVTSGVGVMGPQCRLGTNPEIVVIKFSF